jgi:GT2 family glycosyltransferase
VTIGVVVLTMGDRPDELTRALRSVHDQQGVDLDVLVVVNGPEDVDPGVPGTRTLVVGSNLGVAGGRNLGASEVNGEVLFFLDDDAWLAEPETLAGALVAFDTDSSLGVLSLRVDSPDGQVQRHHVPRLRVGDPSRGSDATTFLGGACLIRRTLFESVGGFPAEFMYAHEETSLAWRALDRGWRIRYDGDHRVLHPHVSPTRHGDGRRLTARNRVLLARRHLPAVVGLLHVTIWLLLAMARDPRGWRDHLRGTAQGLRARDVPRAPIRWRTVWRMARLGRPPIV